VRGLARHGAVQWRGIPYAAPPTGDRRFRAPEPPESWTDERDATRFGPVAMQARDPRAAMMSGIGDQAAMSEDCLALNVYAPASYADGRKRPVVVWIHGGAFIMGTAAMPLYTGRRSRSTTSWPSRSTIDSACWPDVLGDLAAARRATARCSINSPRYAGSATTSPRSAVIRRRSP
ncbi:MAG: carboxylesterase family protein, partial [Kofleriaceae bacterium]